MFQWLFTYVPPLMSVYMFLLRKGPSVYTQYRNLRQTTEYGSYQTLALILVFILRIRGVVMVEGGGDSGEGKQADIEKEQIQSTFLVWERWKGPGIFSVCAVGAGVWVGGTLHIYMLCTCPLFQICVSLTSSLVLSHQLICTVCYSVNFLLSSSSLTTGCENWRT